jgi:magnesium chelatase subunit D
MIYPFAALVGQDEVQLALLLNAVNPALGGVLIRGAKGTAKSTAARALAAVLPPLPCVAGCPFRCDPAAPWPACPHCSELAERPALDAPVPCVNLPLGATEDRVLGSLDFERALRDARRSFQPGLLASAHRGILYIDEVNLLADHLVDVLLDAAALGVNTVEREGIALAHPAQFLLIGTMNPEEGDLRPQLLDRFGLVVTSGAPRDPAVRAEIVRRRLAFETDAVAFNASWAAAQTELRERIRRARLLLPTVILDDGILLFITRLCAELEVDGMRADLGLHRASRAHAAWQGHQSVTLDDVRVAAELVLPHRRRRKPFEPPELDRERFEQLWDDCCSEVQPQENDGIQSDKAGEGGTQTFEPAALAPPRPIDIEPAVPMARLGRGRRNSTATLAQGKHVRSVPDPAASDLALDATMRAAARRGAYRDGRLEIDACDLQRKERSGRTGSLILFVVDASGSMAARQRMAAVKGTVLALLTSAYEQRDRVGVIAFRGASAEVLLPPTASVELAERALRQLPTGGRTPLAHALMRANELLRQERLSHPEYRPLLVLLSDGRANVGLPEGAGDPWQQALCAAGELAASGVAALFLDTEAGLVRLGRGRELAQALAAEHLPLEDLSAERLTLTIRERRAGGR